MEQTAARGLLVAVLVVAPGPVAAQGAAAADSAIVRALRTEALPYVDLQDSALRWDDGRWFNFAKRAAGEHEPGLELFACLVRLAPREEPPRCVAVPLPGIDPDACPAMVTVADFDVTELDGDGRPEFRMVVSYTGPLPRGQSGGETDEHTRLIVVDATPAPRVAFALETRLWSYTSAQRNLDGRVEWADVNGDGHGDVVLVGESCAPRRPGEDCRSLRREFLWVPARDTWRPRGATAR